VAHTDPRPAPNPSTSKFSAQSDDTGFFVFALHGAEARMRFQNGDFGENTALVRGLDAAGQNND
jgi:hypothetical protein